MSYANLKQHLTDNYSHNELADLANHGASGGFGDFIYYDDTVKYFELYKNDCFAVVEEYNDNTGKSGLPVYINSNSSDYIQFANAFIWFAIEYLASQITNGEYITE